MAGGTIRYVPLSPPKDGATKTTSAGEWTVDFDELESAINDKTRMIVCLLQSPPILLATKFLAGHQHTVPPHSSSIEIAIS